MDPTTRPDDELAQQAPLVPDLGRTDDPRTDGGRTTGETPARTTPDIQRAHDDELAQEAPLVPNLGRRMTDTTPR
jgi:hypothetical protein